MGDLQLDQAAGLRRTQGVAHPPLLSQRQVRPWKLGLEGLQAQLQ